MNGEMYISLKLPSSLSENAVLTLAGTLADPKHAPCMVVL